MLLSSSELVNNLVWSIPHPTLENKKTVINRSSKQLSENATTLLSEGMNFAIAPARIPQEEIITEVETAIRHLPKEEAEEIRFETCRILKKSKQYIAI
jgi:hypothetical protein